MTRAEVYTAIGFVILITIIYILLRKLIVWIIEDDQKWHKKKDHLGSSKDVLNERKSWALWRLTEGYIILLAVIIIFSLIKAGIVY